MITTAEFGGVASAQGLDVSNFQGKFGWSAACNEIPGLAFGICKLTEGTGYTDADAGWNWSEISRLGMVRGGYHFGHPGEPATVQAGFFVAAAARIGLRNTDILALDLEVSDGLGPAQVARWAQDFMLTLKSARPSNPLLVYTMISYATGGQCAGLSQYPLWLAWPSSSAPVPPPPWARWTFWQWGSRNGNDADAFNGTTAQLASWLEGYTPVPPPPHTGLYLHTTNAPVSINDLAASRNTTPAKLVELAIENYTAGDWSHMSREPLPVGTRFYTHNP